MRRLCRKLRLRFWRCAFFAWGIVAVNRKIFHLSRGPERRGLLPSVFRQMSRENGLRIRLQAGEISGGFRTIGGRESFLTGTFPTSWRSSTIILYNLYSGQGTRNSRQVRRCFFSDNFPLSFTPEDLAVVGDISINTLKKNITIQHSSKRLLRRLDGYEKL